MHPDVRRCLETGRKTLATSGAIIISSVLDHYLLGGPLTAVMMIAAVQVILAICNYTFDATPVEPLTMTATTPVIQPTKSADHPRTTQPPSHPASQPANQPSN